ncbi:hypothetical protein SP15_254 [Bacillus phage SP-15]|uniref:Uncharacterized protein n=1 Tax=Bacillus phage SP-15 TaxID=1792032 RepID=A0A127AZ47_9CAUD|nr:hypothetical protein SP15_254 [Bacillus phage SP-15]AMM45061.1 hypothetical protein SP15_254 [Bacillus phage SP-15]
MEYSPGFSEDQLVKLATAIIKSDYKSFREIAGSDVYSTQDLDKIIEKSIDLMDDHGLRVRFSIVEQWVKNLNSWGYDY